ncbi:MAG: AbrB family transcriptional regulator [Gammaproteobacteria bacterium RIFCSPHIGHO2_12_FULL_41_20]|nr:MAG: AbrB family transcriptional regulator [Gammaproteobacteria bacterium RIFCSPHIGHO2_12_FULL_41_20]
MHSATLSSKFQICIPKELRQELHIKAGQTFIFIPHGNSIQLVPDRDMKDIRGMMTGASTGNIRDRQDRQ